MTLLWKPAAVTMLLPFASSPPLPIHPFIWLTLDCPAKTSSVWDSAQTMIGSSHFFFLFVFVSTSQQWWRPRSQRWLIAHGQSVKVLKFCAWLWWIDTSKTHILRGRRGLVSSTQADFSIFIPRLFFFSFFFSPPRLTDAQSAPNGTGHKSSRKVSRLHLFKLSYTVRC